MLRVFGLPCEQTFPQAVLPSGELDCLIKGSEGDEEGVDHILVKGVGMEDGDPPDEAIAKQASCVSDSWNIIPMAWNRHWNAQHGWIMVDS